MKSTFLVLSLIALTCCNRLAAQHHGDHPAPTTDTNDYAQPLLAQALRLRDALSFLGSSLSASDVSRLNTLKGKAADAGTIKMIQEILDPYCLAIVNINPETRVKVLRGAAKARLVQSGWVSFLIKVNNEAGVTAQLNVESPNAETPLYAPMYQQRADEKKKLTAAQVANRFLELQLYRNPPMLPNLSGLKMEYAILQVYCKDAGKREADISFNVGQGTQDIGFRNATSILFSIGPAVSVSLHIKDDDGSPAMASFVITDHIERVLNDSINPLKKAGFRLSAAQSEYNSDKLSARLTGIYPLPGRRVAAYDEYPDFFFQPQVYRSDGEHILLPPGKYTIRFTRGPEYITQEVNIRVPENVTHYDVSFQLKRWINMSKLGWYSADHHVHAAGCSHYESPEEGVKPGDMFRQALGEDLNVAALLAWGPGWYHQKTFFTGHDDVLSSSKNILRNDVEVSGFPSSHAGHIVLLGLKEDDYPGTNVIEDWPSWGGPVLSWAKSQGAVTGYAHSGWGLEPSENIKSLPNYVMPKMDGIGANEYIVTVTQNLVDIYSAGNTPAYWELNMWYQTLNCGFRTRLSGETDFPCIFDERVGLARSYFKPAGKLSYESYLDAIKKGSCYVSDGSSHIVDFSVNGKKAGEDNSELLVDGKNQVTVTARAVANLPAEQDEMGKTIAERDLTDQPYWHIERARIGTSRKVRVELIVNGQPVDTSDLTADADWHDIKFKYTIDHSSWIALRIYPSCHTNPVFVIVDGKPIREIKSASWCRQAVDQCWKMKQGKIRASEQAEAAAMYDKARKFYDSLVNSFPVK